MGWIKTAYRGLIQGEYVLRHILLFAVRLYWGALLLLAGLGKWIHLAPVVQYFASLDLPYPRFTAGLAASIELLGALSLLLGFLTPIFSLLLTAFFFTAYGLAHKQALLEFFSHPSLFIAEQPFLFLYASLLILCFGPGALSIDYWLHKDLG